MINKNFNFLSQDVNAGNNGIFDNHLLGICDTFNSKLT